MCGPNGALINKDFVILWWWIRIHWGEKDDKKRKKQEKVFTI